MKKTKVKIFKAVYYLLNLMTALAVCYLGSLTLNTDMVATIGIIKLITLICVIFTIIVTNGLLSYKLDRLNQ